jgi:predicted DNA-binding transcriptional regulator AlpA
MRTDYHDSTCPPKWPIRPGHELPRLPLAMRPAMAARAIGISERTLWTLTKRGEVPHARIGRAVIYPTAAILKWLEEITANPPVQRPTAAGGEA